MSDPLYTGILLTHYYFPQNYGLREDFDVEAKGYNPLCGDLVIVRAKFHDGSVGDISFEHQGCVISRAAASLLYEEIKGKSREKIRALALPDALSFLGIPLMPARIKCAALALETIQKIV